MSNSTTTDDGGGKFTATYGWLIAVICECCASTIGNVGMNIQKIALTKFKDDKIKLYLVMALGLSFMIAASGGDTLALSFGAASIVTPLGSMNIVANIFLAPILQGETITKTDVLYTMIIIAGCVVTVVFADHQSQDYTLPQLFGFFGSINFAIYIACILSILILSLLNIKRIERIESIKGKDSVEYKANLNLHRYSYAATSGVAGAQSILFVKLLVSLIASWAQGGLNLFLSWQTYVAILALVFAVVSQIYLLNCGLARWDALYNIPIFSSHWIIFSVLGGGIVYGEFSSFNITQSICFPLGIFVTVSGVLLLSQRGESAKTQSNNVKDKFNIELAGNESPTTPTPNPLFPNDKKDSPDPNPLMDKDQ